MFRDIILVRNAPNNHKMSKYFILLAFYISAMETSLSNTHIYIYYSLLTRTYIKINYYIFRMYRRNILRMSLQNQFWSNYILPSIFSSIDFIRTHMFFLGFSKTYHVFVGFLESYVQDLCNGNHNLIEYNF